MKYESRGVDVVEGRGPCGYTLPRRGGRVVECGGLENRYVGNPGVGGSNPPLSAFQHAAFGALSAFQHASSLRLSLVSTALRALSANQQGYAQAEMLKARDLKAPSVLTSGVRRAELADKRSPQGVAC
jgi:hypothetical protein